MGRWAREGFRGAAPDYDGSVSGTGRHAEGTATASKGKGSVHAAAISSFFTIARTGLVPDVGHRPGNVRDFNGAVPSSTTVWAKCARAFPAQVSRPASTAPSSTEPSSNN